MCATIPKGVMHPSIFDKKNKFLYAINFVSLMQINFVTVKKKL